VDIACWNHTPTAARMVTDSLNKLQIQLLCFPATFVVQRGTGTLFCEAALDLRIELFLMWDVGCPRFPQFAEGVGTTLFAPRDNKRYKNPTIGRGLTHVSSFFASVRGEDAQVFLLGFCET